MSNRCLQCDHTGDLAEHAAQAGHWLCQSCGSSLPEDRNDWYACEGCLSSSRSLLSTIETLWKVLPAQLGHLSSGWGRERSNDTNLPGGDALVLMAPGGTGRSETGATHSKKDPQSVAFALMTWHDDWLHTRREPAAMATGSRAVSAAVSYLDTHARWAAQHHEAFSDYLSDLRDLQARLMRVHALDDATQVGQGRCFDCDRALRRESNTGTVCGHTRPDPEPEMVWKQVGDKERWVRVLTAAQVQARHDAALMQWEAQHAACGQGGLSDFWTCPKCRRWYNDHDYARVLLDAASEGDWVSIKRAAELLAVPERTVQSWYRRREVEGKSIDGRVWVRFSGVETRSKQQEAS